MNNNHILLKNLGILAAYMLIITAVSGGGVLVVSILPIAIHVFVNLILFLANFGRDRSLSYTHLLSAFLVLLIGFPSCWGLAGIAGNGVFF